MKRIILWSLATTLIFIVAYVLLNLSEFKRFAQVLPTYYAKESCTCLFVHKESEESCHERLKQWLPIKSFHKDLQNRLTEVEALGSTRRAQFINQHIGCKITN